MSDSGLQKFPEISRKSASTLVEMVSGNLRPTQKKPTPRPICAAWTGYQRSSDEEEGAHSPGRVPTPADRELLVL